MKRLVSALAGLFALGWAGMAFAQAANTITTTCPTNFTCSFSAAETLAFGTPKNQGAAGQPDVFVGYLSFVGTTYMLVYSQNLNGTFTSSLTKTGSTCTNGMNGAPALVTFSDGTQLSFVLDSLNSPTLLQFILANDSSTSKTANSVQVGSCHKLI